MDEKPINVKNIDVNSPDFYETIRTEIDSDMARMKKDVEVLLYLRMDAAELEVETAALHHAELWYELLDIQDDPQENSADEACDETNDTQIT